MSTPPVTVLQPPVSERDHVLGPATAPVVVTEFGDFECPHCARAAIMIRDLRSELGEQFRFVYRHFPLGKIHPHARKAAEVSEAAAAQDKFWEVHDDLFDHSRELELDAILTRAGEMGLDVDRMRKEIEAGTYTARVQEDLSSGIRSGVNGTPTFFINGKRVAGVVTAEFLRNAILTPE